MTALEPLLREMVAAAASDLFLAEGRPPAWRIDGMVTVTLHPPTSRDDIEALLDAILRPTQRRVLDETGDLDVGKSQRGVNNITQPSELVESVGFYRRISGSVLFCTLCQLPVVGGKFLTGRNGFARAILS